MTTSDPALHVAAYCAAFATGEAGAIDRLYEPDAILVPRPGTPLTGPAGRVPAHQHLLTLGGPMTARPRHVYTTGDIALVIVDWALQGTALRGTATDVLRRGGDGRWRYAIDNPFGTT